MYPILEVSTSLYFEPSHANTPQEIDSKVESSPFLKLLEEAQTSPKEEPLETEETSTHEEVEEKLESSPKEEIEENTEPKILTFIPTNWEVSELTQTAELSDTEIVEEELQISSPEESLELLSQENVLQTEEVQQVEAELEFQNFEFVSKQETQVQNSKEIALSQEVTEKTSLTSQTENLTLKENLVLEETAKIFNEDSLEKELVPQASLQLLQAEVQPVLKIKSEVTKPASSEESKQSKINSESKETKLSSDLLSLFKNNLSPKEESSIFNEPIETKQVSLSPNVKLLQKEELPQTKEVNFAQSTEKENSNITWSVQNFRNPNTKDVNNKTVVHESFKSTNELFQKNTPEIVKTARLQVLENGKNFALIELEPKELGRVTLQIFMENEKIHGKLFFETEAAKLIFQSELQNLKNELRVAGLEIESLLIDLNNPDQNSKESFAFSEFFESPTKQEKLEEAELPQEEVLQINKRLLDVRV